MSYLYLTADKVGMASGGGRVTQEESTALHDLAVMEGEECQIWGRDELYEGIGKTHPLGNNEPWFWDDQAWDSLWKASRFHVECPFSLVHAYAGTFTNTVGALRAQGRGIRIAYTAAAHDIHKSRDEHLKLGLPFDYPHLNDPQLWNRYVGGYRAADVVVCPSQHSAECMHGYGCQRVEIIPHGVDIVGKVKPPPGRFIVGYLGAVGPDKGLVYLLQAWKKLNYPDATLVIAGRDSQSPFVGHLAKDVPHISLAGWIGNIADFYSNISLYVQPSITEGFGIEVLEAMAHGRAVLVSDGAGAADVVPHTWQFPAGNVDTLAEKIDQFRKCDLGLMGSIGRGLAAEYSWEKIRARYQDLWRRLLA